MSSRAAIAFTQVASCSFPFLQCVCPSFTCLHGRPQHSLRQLVAPFLQCVCSSFTCLHGQPLHSLRQLVAPFLSFSAYVLHSHVFTGGHCIHLVSQLLLSFPLVRISFVHMSSRAAIAFTQVASCSFPFLQCVCPSFTCLHGRPLHSLRLLVAPFLSFSAYVLHSHVFTGGHCIHLGSQLLLSFPLVRMSFVHMSSRAAIAFTQVASCSFPFLQCVCPSFTCLHGRPLHSLRQLVAPFLSFSSYVLHSHVFTGGHNIHLGSQLLLSFPLVRMSFIHMSSRAAIAFTQIASCSFPFLQCVCPSFTCLHGRPLHSLRQLVAPFLSFSAYVLHSHVFTGGHSIHLGSQLLLSFPLVRISFVHMSSRAAFAFTQVASCSFPFLQCVCPSFTCLHGRPQHSLRQLIAPFLSFSAYVLRSHVFTGGHCIHLGSQLLLSFPLVRMSFIHMSSRAAIAFTQVASCSFPFLQCICPSFTCLHGRPQHSLRQLVAPFLSFSTYLLHSHVFTGSHCIHLGSQLLLSFPLVRMSFIHMSSRAAIAFTQVASCSFPFLQCVCPSFTCLHGRPQHSLRQLVAPFLSFSAYILRSHVFTGGHCIHLGSQLLLSFPLVRMSFIHMSSRAAIAFTQVANCSFRFLQCVCPSFTCLHGRPLHSLRQLVAPFLQCVCPSFTCLHGQPLHSLRQLVAPFLSFSAYVLHSHVFTGGHNIHLDSQLLLSFPLMHMSFIHMSSRAAIAFTQVTSCSFPFLQCVCPSFTCLHGRP